MIHRFVHFALRQRFLVLMVTALMVIAGAWSFRQMPVTVRALAASVN